MTIRLFISYRRADAEHAAQRVRAAMRDRFGEDAVFIDRDIPAGDDWDAELNRRLAASSDVIVLIGDNFVRELRKRASGTAATDRDVLKAEIEGALKQGKRIYPVVIGRKDMPEARVVPPEIAAFCKLQAVFAGEPAFDTAVAKLADAIAASHGVVAVPQERMVPSGPASFLLPAVAALLAPVLCGWLIEFLAFGHAGPQVERAFWFGTHYLLLTLVLGLGPYLVYRTVAEIRVRASLQVRNVLGTLTMLNMTLALCTGCIFLLLSTRADWALRLRGILPPQPSALDYARQGVVLVGVVFAAVPVALLEPFARRTEGARRQIWMMGLDAASSAALLGNLWLAYSLSESLPSMAGLCGVPLIGYFSLAPALPLLLITWGAARARLGLNTRALHSRLLISLALCLYGLATLSYFAHGPLHLMTGVPINAPCPAALLPAPAT